VSIAAAHASGKIQAEHQTTTAFVFVWSGNNLVPCCVLHVKITIIALALCHMHISNVAKLPGFTQLDYTDV
jgi:hypothetical protein